MVWRLSLSGPPCLTGCAPYSVAFGTNRDLGREPKPFAEKVLFDTYLAVLPGFDIRHWRNGVALGRIPLADPSVCYRGGGSLLCVCGFVERS